jgi:hypothetical protein
MTSKKFTLMLRDVTALLPLMLSNAQKTIVMTLTAVTTASVWCGGCNHE